MKRHASVHGWKKGRAVGRLHQRPGAAQLHARCDRHLSIEYQIDAFILAFACQYVALLRFWASHTPTHPLDPRSPFVRGWFALEKKIN
jgi:hypothetical protein